MTFLTREQFAEELKYLLPCSDIEQILQNLEQSRISQEVRLTPGTVLILDWVNFGVGRRYSAYIRRRYF